MKYFFKDHDNDYFNPLNGMKELCIFNLEVLEFNTYTVRSYIKKVYKDEISPFPCIDLDRYSTTTVFLCIMKHENGLYLSHNFVLSKIPCIWHFIDDNENMLFTPWYHHNYTSLTFTNETNTPEEFYTLNGYYVYKKNNLIDEEFLKLCKSLDKIQRISYVLKTPNAYDIFCNRIIHYKDQPDIWSKIKLKTCLYEDPGDRYSFILYSHQNFLKSQFLCDPSIIICGDNSCIQLQYAWIKIPGVELKF